MRLRQWVGVPGKGDQDETVYRCVWSDYKARGEGGGKANGDEARRARERDTGRVRDRGEQGEGESKTRGEGKKQRHHRHEKKTTAYVCMKSKLPDKVVPITPRKHLWVLI